MYQNVEDSVLISSSSTDAFLSPPQPIGLCCPEKEAAKNRAMEDGGEEHLEAENGGHHFNVTNQKH